MCYCSHSVCQVTLTRRGWSTFDYVITLPKRWNAGVTNPDCIPHQRVLFFFPFLSFFFKCHDQKMGVMTGAEVHSVDSHIVRKIPLFHLLPTHTHTHTTGRAQWTSARPSLISPFSFSPLSWRKLEGSALRCYYYLHFSSHPAEQQCLTNDCKNRILHPPAKPCGFSSQIKMDVFFHWLHLKLVEASSFMKATSVGQHWPPKMVAAFSKLVNFYFVCLYLKKNQLNKQKNKTRKQQTLNR